MKKILCVVLCLCIVFLAACSTAEDAPKEVIELTLWHYYTGSTGDLFESLVDEFNVGVGEELGISVTPYTYSELTELESVLFSAANKEVGAPDLPDIFATYTDTAFALDNYGVLAALDSYFSEEELAAYRSEFMDDGRLGENNELKIIPVAKSTELLFINSNDFAIFSEATGVTYDMLSTWEGLVDAAEAYYNWTDSLTEASGDGKAFFGFDSYSNFILVALEQLGHELYTIEGGEVNINFSEDAARHIWDTLYIPYMKGHFSAAARFRSDDVQTGILLAYVGSSSSANYFPAEVTDDKDVTRPIEGHVLPLPVFAEPHGVAHVAIQQGAGMAVSKTDEVRERAAVEFLKWFTATEQNSSFAYDTGYLPVMNSSLSTEVLESVLGEDIDSMAGMTAETVLLKLDRYEFYTQIQFEGGYETRNVLRYTLSDLLVEDIASLESRLMHGGERSALVDEYYDTDQHFNEWYLSCVSALEAAVS